MGQVWQIINVDAREASNHVWGELGAWFFYPHEHLLNHISIPCLPQEVDEWLSDGPSFQQTAPLFTLPIETLDLIYDELRALHHVAYLALTCKALLVVGKRHLLRATKEHYAPWAGGRLISLGAKTRRLSDLPPNLLTETERKEIEDTDLLAEDHDRNLTNFSQETYQRVFNMDWRMRRINDAIHNIHAPYRWRLVGAAYQFQNQCESAWTKKEKALDIDPSARREAEMLAALVGNGRYTVYPEGLRVLCNLSKGEYVRDDGLTVPNYANLAHALLAKICWSSDSEVGMVCEDAFKSQLTRGAWAGDRFCVTTVALLPELDDGKLWKDVTEEVCALLSHIWQNNAYKWIIFCNKHSRGDTQK